jgi:hypothetical protein
VLSSGSSPSIPSHAEMTVGEFLRLQQSGVQSSKQAASV